MITGALGPPAEPIGLGDARGESQGGIAAWTSSLPTALTRLGGVNRGCLGDHPGLGDGGHDGMITGALNSSAKSIRLGDGGDGSLGGMVVWDSNPLGGGDHDRLGGVVGVVSNSSVASVGLGDGDRDCLGGIITGAPNPSTEPIRLEDGNRGYLCGMIARASSFPTASI